MSYVSICQLWDWLYKSLRFFNFQMCFLAKIKFWIMSYLLHIYFLKWMYQIRFQHNEDRQIYIYSKTYNFGMEVDIYAILAVFYVVTKQTWIIVIFQKLKNQCITWNGSVLVYTELFKKTVSNSLLNSHVYWVKSLTAVFLFQSVFWGFLLSKILYFPGSSSFEF